MPSKKDEQLAEDVKLCGHINKHFYNTKGRLEDLACTLPVGHTGDHSAPSKKNVGEQVIDEKGRVVKVTYHAEDDVAYWGDAAGRPADEIKAGAALQMNLMQKDLVMEIMAKNANNRHFTVEQAVAQAKGMPQWNSVSEPS